MLLIGLGNIGKEYQNNRHNVGFMTIDTIVEKYGFSNYKTKFKGELSVGEIDGKKIYAIKPSTLMNRSGISVVEIVRFYKIPLDEVYVFYDDLDVVLGKLKTKIGGGSGGHNGIKSLDEHIGKGYNRIRIGISRPNDKNKVHSYVLSDFNKEQRLEIDILISKIVDNLPVLLNGENADFTTKMGLLQDKIMRKKSIFSPLMTKI